MAKKKTKISVDPYLESFMGKFLERFVVLEKKVDVVISKLGQAAPQVAGAKSVLPQQPPAPPRREKQLYEAICADCSKVCEVPFRPTENRPVYCKDCWAKRRGQGHGMPILKPVSLPPKPVSKLGLPPEPAPVPTAAKKSKKSAVKASKKAKKKK